MPRSYKLTSQNQESWVCFHLRGSREKKQLSSRNTNGNLKISLPISKISEEETEELPELINTLVSSESFFLFCSRFERISQGDCPAWTDGGISCWFSLLMIPAAFYHNCYAEVQSNHRWIWHQRVHFGHPPRLRSLLVFTKLLLDPIGQRLLHPWHWLESNAHQMAPP